MQTYTTQMDAARKGIVTPEMEVVAKKEYRTTEEIRQWVSEGKVAIPANKHHTCLNPEGVGSMLRTKINVNLGVSRDCKDYNIEMQKVMSAVTIHRYVLARTQKELTVKFHDCIEMYRDADLTEDSNMTLGEWLDRWINEYMIFTIRESTLDSYKAMIKNQIKPYLGDRPLSALTTQELQKFYNTVKKKGRVKPDKLHGTELADSMVRGIHMMLHEALDMAVRLRLIVKNPTVGTTIPKNNYPPKQILNDEQLDRFMKRIRQDERWYDFFYTELTTGLRRGEICGLKWEDFDAENGKLKVRRSVAKRKGGGLNIGETKTETGTRTIVLPPSTAELLRKRKETAVSEWIFPNIYEPEKPMHPDYAYHRLKTLLKQAELPLIRFHDLRHTFATHALAGGVDAKTLSGILGHTNASFTLDTYTHVTTDMQRNASAIVGSFMDEIMLEGDDTNR